MLARPERSSWGCMVVTMDTILEWIKEHQTALIVGGATSVAAILLSMIAIPIVAIKLPKDYFAHEKRPSSKGRGAGGMALRIGKNILGWVLVVAGVAMLVLPGQGIIAVLIGLMLVDFPGKFRVLKWIVKKDKVRNTLNWIRRKAGKPELEFEEGGEEGGGTTKGSPRTSPSVPAYHS